MNVSGQRLHTKRLTALVPKIPASHVQPDPIPTIPKLSFEIHTSTSDSWMFIGSVCNNYDAIFTTELPEFDPWTLDTKAIALAANPHETHCYYLLMLIKIINTRQFRFRNS